MATDMSEARCGCMASISNVGSADNDRDGEHRIPTNLDKNNRQLSTEGTSGQEATVAVLDRRMISEDSGGRLSCSL